MNLLGSVFCLKYWAIIPYYLIFHVFLIVKKEPLIVPLLPSSLSEILEELKSSYEDALRTLYEILPSH